MKTVRLGNSGDCAYSYDCFPLDGLRKNKKAWIGDAQVLIATLNSGEERHVIHVNYDSRQGARAGVMDCVTGTMYRPDGTCLTSDVLKIVSMAVDAADTLMKKRPISWGDFTRKTPL